ncbi:amidohydrolase [Actinocrinis puniceicyclus]|uniref:Amidohydrolase n=1 Tax=Actinocrinis puniceicyclus TaxID=977794 RepID=A0A8J7WKH6_9ACTN|nr:amidohydrolase [Actinocrinis puniceicyclus]MBS2962540.1 amidohydrolase [Actinocrinis puniceicyclus]
MTVTAIVGGRIVPVDGEPIEGGTVLIEDGRISALGDRDLPLPEDAEVVDAAGKWVLPGFIEAHGHLGVYEEGEGWAGNDTNELTDPVTAHVRALDAINPDEQGWRDAIIGGVLAVNVNPGSGNPIGGQSVALKCWGGTVDDRVLREPAGIKSALGENPKRVYGDQKKSPSTRLGTAAVIRGAFVEAHNYLARIEAEAAKPAEERKPVERDLKLEALGRVLRREIPWRQHVHRADDIATALRIADEFGYELVIDHGTEAHLVADKLAARGVPVIIGPLFTSRSKVELRNRSLANPGRLARAGVTIAITTDHPVVPINFLVHQATLAVKEGLDRETALRALTVNPARILGIDHRLGSLTVGKDADLCVWSGDPLDVMQRVERAFVDGREIYVYDYASAEGVFAR